MTRDEPGRIRDDGADSLSVQVAGGNGEPEKLYVLTRPRAGTVEVREFRFGEHRSEPLVYAASCASLLDGFERAHKDRRRLSEDMHRIRRWLDG
jgi:hypothetical protein